MKRARFPDLQTLALRLAAILGGDAQSDPAMIILDRRTNPAATTFPSEIVTCQIEHGRELQLFCKYAYRRKARRHQCGIAYEAQVYHHVLRPAQMSTPTFYGGYIDSQTGEAWLVLEHLERSIHIKEAEEPNALELAARWAGIFHAAEELRLATDMAPALRRYDSAYYVGWFRRTAQFAGHMHQRFPWLAPLCAYAEDLIAPLLQDRPTVIHGEYYPHNILFRDRTVYPVDWESAAVACGAIDPAALTEGWPEEDVRAWERAYQTARWPAGSPPDFARTLDSARLYLQFRWLGDRPSWTTDQSSLWRFEQLHCIAQRLGYL